MERTGKRSLGSRRDRRQQREMTSEPLLINSVCEEIKLEQNVEEVCKFLTHAKLIKTLQLAHFLCSHFLFPAEPQISVVKRKIKWTVSQLHLAIKTALDCETLRSILNDCLQKCCVIVLVPNPSVGKLWVLMSGLTSVHIRKLGMCAVTHMWKWETGGDKSKTDRQREKKKERRKDALYALTARLSPAAQLEACWVHSLLPTTLGPHTHTHKHRVLLRHTQARLLPLPLLW